MFFFLKVEIWCTPCIGTQALSRTWAKTQGARAVLTSSLGDTQARKDTEARNAKANAPALATAMRDEVLNIYNLKVPPSSFADAVL